MALLATPTAKAQTTWNAGGGSSDWSNNANWTSNAPAAGVATTLPGGTAFEPGLSSASDSGSVTQSGAALNLNNQTLTVTGGYDLGAGSITGPGSVSVSGNFNQTGGTVGGGVTLTAAGVAVNGGTFDSSATVTATTLSNASTFNASGGAVNAAVTNTGAFNVTGAVTGNNSFANNGGTLAVTAAGSLSGLTSITNAATVSTALLLGGVSVAVAQTTGSQQPNTPAAPAAATPKAAAAPAAAPATTPAPSGATASTALPDRTTASFGDWTLRCERRRDGSTPAKICELSQAIQRAGDTGALAQVAIGRLSASEPLRLTVVLPLNVSLQSSPRVGPETKDAFPVLSSPWQRCVPSGCLASVSLSDDALKKIRGGGEAAKMEYRDAAEREVSVAFSLRGLSEALDALSREAVN